MGKDEVWNNQCKLSIVENDDEYNNQINFFTISLFINVNYY